MNQNNTIDNVVERRAIVDFNALSKGLSNIGYAPAFDNLVRIELDYSGPRVGINYIRIEASKQISESQKRDIEATQYLKQVVANAKSYKGREN